MYAFGFMLMCPQLYLNYKLKSVAHLPWRQMSYKFLNTIIDDLFAFVIKMPLLHRLSVFRDDLVFLVYIYQRWIYRVDMKRVNEFGFVGEDPNAPEAPALTDGAAPALAAPTGDGESGAAAVDDVAAVGTAGAKAVKGRKNAKKQQVRLALLGVVVFACGVGSACVWNHQDRDNRAQRRLRDWSSACVSGGTTCS